MTMKPGTQTKVADRQSSVSGKCEEHDRWDYRDLALLLELSLHPENARCILSLNGNEHVLPLDLEALDSQRPRIYGDLRRFAL